MIKYFLSMLLFLNVLDANKNLIDCDQVFTQRKDELLREMERIDDREQEFRAYQDASKALMEERDKKLSQKINELNEKTLKIEETKKDIVKLYEDNKKLLTQIDEAKDEKISKAYLKMKDKKAAAILDDMTRIEAAKILFNLTPKKISKIMEKMNPANASDVTLLLKEGPPFDRNNTIEHLE